MQFFSIIIMPQYGVHKPYLLSTDLAGKLLQHLSDDLGGSVMIGGGRCVGGGCWTDRQMVVRHITIGFGSIVYSDMTIQGLL